MKKVRLFIDYLYIAKPYTGLISITFISDISLAVISMLPPLFSVAIFDYAYPNKDMFLFTFFIVAGIAIYFIDTFLSASVDYINKYIDVQTQYDLSKRLFYKIECLPLGAYARSKIGDFTVRLIDDVSQTVDLITGFIPMLIMNISKLGFFLFVSFKMDARITVLALFSVPLYIIETKFFSDKLENIRTDTQIQEGKIYDCINERLLNIRTIKAFSQEGNEVKNFCEKIMEKYKISIKEKITAIAEVFSNSVTLRVWGFFIAWYLGYEVINGYLSFGELIALGMYIPMLQDPISDMSSLYKNYKICMVSVERIDKIMRMPEESMEKEGDLELDNPDGAIKFNKLFFGYDPKTYVLADININVQANKSVAVVGASGSGKTTLVNLLMRFYRAEKGAIYIDGKDISKMKLDSLRRNVGAVFQEVSLFEGTVKDNISYGSSRKTDEEIINAAKMAQAHEFISRFPGGYNYRIKPQGANLSGGQRQRIALARIFLYNPRVIILDEATSAIDPESEFLIQETINKCMGKKTLFIIAHRLSTIKKVDRIIVLDRGRIAEEGTFEELLNKKGKFFKLYNYQFGGFEIFKEHFETEFQRYIRYKQDLSLIIMEVNDFEKLAKKYPFEKTLEFINEINLFIRRNLRVMDISTAFHEKQILVALPEVNVNGAKAFCKRILELLKREKFRIDNDKIAVDIIMGIVSCMSIHAQYGEDLFEMAAEVLESARTGGQNIAVYT